LNATIVLVFKTNSKTDLVVEGSVSSCLDYNVIRLPPAKTHRKMRHGLIRA